MRGGKWLLLVSLYVSQGLPYGFFVQALPVLLRRQGLSLEWIGLSSLLALPWALKFLWAPAVERAFWPGLGRRRSWLLPLQGAMALAMVGLSSWAPARSLGVVLAGVLLINVLSATQDIATDGLALDLLAPEERGLANGVQVAGYRAGMVLGGGALLALFERLGWSWSFLAMGGLLVLLTGPVAAHREAVPVPRAGEERSGVRFWKRVDRWRLGGLLVTYKLGEAFSVGMLRPWMTDQGLSLAEIGWALGVVGFAAGLVGALAGGALVPRLGRRRALELFAALQAVAVAGYALASTQGAGPWLLPLCAAEHLASGMATAALFTCMMDWSSTEAGASDYTFQASLVVISTGAAAALSGVSAAHLGYTGHFSAAALLAGLVPLATRWLAPPGGKVCYPGGGLSKEAA
ncbi:MAG: MFS transporter [Polyangiaceae bacterium]|jgi:MFS family permease|nr:MFS transporter [Polyangiaceae bacterium]